jgi:hypothetical protein
MDILDCVKRIELDAKSLNSKMKRADDDWHDRLARVLLIVFQNPQTQSELLPRLKTLPLIPVGGQQWTSITDQALFFPHSNGMPIPLDLGLRLVEYNAIQNATRKTLFTKLGVVDADPIVVRNLILEKHKSR